MKARNVSRPYYEISSLLVIGGLDILTTTTRYSTTDISYVIASEPRAERRTKSEVEAGERGNLMLDGYIEIASSLPLVAPRNDIDYFKFSKNRSAS